ncbi:MAG: hypothetical protein ACOYJH_03555 [Anaerovoracaceae bacterium]
MKKTISVLLSLILAFSVIGLTGCTTAGEEVSNDEVNKDIQQTYSDLKEQYDKDDTCDAVFSYVKWWADQNDGLTYEKINADSIVLSSGATKGYKKAESTLFEFNSGAGCASSEKKNYAQVLSLALTTMKDSVNHGDVRLLITRNPSSLKKSDFRADNIISLTHGNDTAIYSGGAATAEYTFTKSLTTTESDGKTAYRITIDGLEGGSTGDTSRTHPNPSEEIASFINSCQSSKINLEIASFEGGTSYDTYQTKATAVVVVSGSSADKFQEKADKEAANYTDKNISKESDMTFTVSEVNVPSKVYSAESEASVLSLMYTMSNGVFETIDGEDSGDSIAVSELGYLRMTGSKFTAMVSARSIDADVMKEMNKEFKATATLNDMSFKADKATPLWPYDVDSSLASELSQATSEYGFKLDTQFTYEKTDLAIMYSKNKKINAVLFATNMENGYAAVRSMMLFLFNLNQ